MTTNELKELIARRGILKGHITQFKNYLSRYAQEPDSVKLSVKMRRTNKSFDAFEDVQLAIENLDTEGNHATEREAIEQQYDDLITEAEKILNPRTENIQSCSSPSTTTNRSCGVKLPKIDLPRFDGKLEQWLSFKSQFISMIDKQVTLTDNQKLHYLRSALSGETAETLNSLDLTDDNYHHAWELLNQNYANKRFIVWRHGDLLLDVPPLERHSAASIRRLTNTVRQHLNSLKTLGEPVNHWDTMVILTLLRKFDRETRMEFEKTLAADEVPTLHNLFSFLLDRARYLEAGDQNTKQPPPSSKPNTRFQQPEPTRSRPKQLQTFNTTIISCSLCQNNTHRIYDCEVLRKATVPERKRIITEANLCSNCLRKGHSTSQCRSIACRTCDGRHHTLLHEDPPDPDQS